MIKNLKQDLKIDVHFHSYFTYFYFSAHEHMHGMEHKLTKQNTFS